MANLFFNPKALNKVKQALWRSGRNVAKNPVQIDYLVKMNLPPLLGRRNAIYTQVVRLLNTDLFSLPDMERLSMLNSCSTLLDEAINNTEAIIITLSNLDTANREKQFLSFMELLRDLIDSVAKLEDFNDHIERDKFNITKFLGPKFSKTFKRQQSKLNSCELHIINTIQEMIKNAEPAILRYWEYTKSSFNQHNAKRYQRSFDRTSAVYFSTAVEKPMPPEGW